MKATNKRWFAAWVTGGLLFASPLTAQQPADTAAEATSPAGNQNAQTNTAAQVLEDTNAAPAKAEAAAKEDQQESWRDRARPPMVSIGKKDVELKAGDVTEALVVIGGSAKVHGKVRDAAVVIGGDLEVDGVIGDAAVAVLGSINAKPGAKIHGEAVAVGGRVNVAEGASVPRPTQVEWPDMRWLRSWFVHCALLLRPLSLSVGWVWVFMGTILLFYLLIAVIFPRPVQACAGELTRRPASSFLVGMLTILLVPFVILLLAVTGVGLVVVPFILAAVFVASLVGKVGFLEWLGLKFGAHFESEPFRKPLVAFLIGAAILLVLYLVPVLGLLTFGVSRIWALGAAIMAVFGGLRRELPEKRAGVSPGPGGGPGLSAKAMPMSATMASAMAAGTGEPVAMAPSASAAAEMPGSAGVSAQTLAAAAPVTPPVLPDTLSYPRAGFWERVAAGFLDAVLLCILSALVGGIPLGLLVAVAYFTGMWAWRGTTIGGIVLGLKVARIDGQPVTFAVALVRALAAAFSIVVLCLGFIWIAWDPEKQGWHDKIAGTVVLRTPRGTPLICL